MNVTTVKVVCGKYTETGVVGECDELSYMASYTSCIYNIILYYISELDAFESMARMAAGSRNELTRNYSGSA